MGPKLKASAQVSNPDQVTLVDLNLLMLLIGVTTTNFMINKTIAIWFLSELTGNVNKILVNYDRPYTEVNF